MIELKEKHRAVVEAIQLPALLQGVFQGLGIQAGHGNLAVLEQVQRSVAVGGNVRHVDDVQADSIFVPVALVLLEANVGAVYPAGHGEWPVVQEIFRIGAVAAVARIKERFSNRQIGGERDQFVEVGHGPLEGDLQGSGVYRSYAELIRVEFTLVDRLGVFDGKHDEGVLGSRFGADGPAPRKNEIRCRHGFSIAPARVLTQVEDGAFGADLPVLCNAWNQAVLCVIAQQTFHDVAHHVTADLIGHARAVELRRFAGE